MKRHKAKGLSVATNPEHILTEINSHAMFAQVEKPNQTDPEFITYDIACNEDFALHAKYHDWKKIFQFFVDHPRAKATLATKIIPEAFLKFNPQGKVRIRFSMMPQVIADKLEPNTAKILDRINAVNKFKEAGYDVHLNFSPVVVYDHWKEDYQELFSIINALVDKQYKKDVLAEVIFLTHNQEKHQYNLEHNISGEDLLWTPEIQESKTSQYGGENVRYRRDLKAGMIAEFKSLHNDIIPWNTIRYCFTFLLLLSQMI